MSAIRKTLNLALSGNRLIPTDSVTNISTYDAGVQGENGAVELSFSIPSDWASLSVSIVATASDGTYQTATGTGTVTLDIPSALLTNPGQLFVHVEGTDGINTRKTEDCILRVHPSAPEITPVQS